MTICEYYFYASASLRLEALCSRVGLSVSPFWCPSVCPSGLHFFWNGRVRRGWSRLIKKKISQGGHMGGFNKYLFLGSFFHLTQYCSLCGLHLFTGGEGQAVGGIKANLIFLPGGCGGFKTNLNKKLGGGQGKLLLFFHNFRLDYFFFKWES